MSTLPRQLQPWATQLALFQRDLAIGLAPWIQRLAAAIGSLAGSPNAHTGDPDGYDGVVRRGPYERLLPTEWLFADAAPDEFNRRAATGEHQFYRLATREPNATRRCLVLFDAGPSQLGTPRIAHLAALIVFATRCEAAKAELFWGTLQAGPSQCQQGFSKARAETLLDGRSALEGTAEQLQAWLNDPAMRSDDVWLVGAPTSPGSPKVNRLEVTDVLEVGVRRVDVVVKRPARSVLRLQLDLPAADACTRLLRDPFAPDPQAHARGPIVPVLPHSDVVFGMVANRIHMLGRNGELIILPMPQGEVPWRTKAVIYCPPEGEKVVAAGWNNGPFAVVARHDAAGTLTEFGICHLTRRGTLKSTPWVYAVSGKAPALLEGLKCAAFTPQGVMVVFGDGVLTLAGSRAAFSPMPIVASAVSQAGLVVLTYDSTGRRFATFVDVSDSKPFHLHGTGTLCAFFGRGYLPMSHPRIPALATAHRRDDPEWTLDTYTGRVKLEVPREDRVVAMSASSAHVTGLVVQAANHRSLSFHSKNARRTIGNADADIVSFATDFASDCVAWLDADGVIGLANLNASGRFMRATPVKASHRWWYTLHKAVP